MSVQDCEQLTLFPADSHASRLAVPGSEEAARTTVTSGRRCLELSTRSDPVGSLVKMLLGSSIWRSTRCYLTWKVSATPARRLLYRLVPSTPRTDATALRLWATPTAAQRGMTSRTAGRPMEKSTNLGTQVYLAETALFPTPTRFDATAGDLKGKEYTGTKHAMKLIQAANLWPTPTAREYKGGRNPETLAAKGRLPSNTLSDSVKSAGGVGQLNPDWVEWLMGFPLGWSEVKCGPQSRTSQGR